MTIVNKAGEFTNCFTFEAKDFELTKNSQIRTFVTFPDTVGAGTIAIDQEGSLYTPTFNILDEINAGFLNYPDLYRITKTASRSIIVDRIKGQIGSVFLDDSGILYPVLRSAQEINPLSTNENEIALIEHDGFEINKPVGIYVTYVKTIFLTDKMGSTIIKIDPTGLSSLFASVVNNPRGITGDEMGNLYISHDNQDGTISKISPDGSISLFANILTFRPEQYNLPHAMWVGHITYYNSNLYVCGISTDRVYKVAMNGTVEVFTGSGERGIPRGRTLTA